MEASHRIAGLINNNVVCPHEGSTLKMSIRNDSTELSAEIRKQIASFFYSDTPAFRCVFAYAPPTHTHLVLALLSRQLHVFPKENFPQHRKLCSRDFHTLSFSGKRNRITNNSVQVNFEAVANRPNE